MNPWWNLLKKEYRMSRTSILTILAIVLIAGLWLMYSNRQHLGIVIAPASLLVIFALFYPVVFMLNSVSKELKNTPHLWLHCPQPAWMLLSAKLLTAVSYALLFLVLAGSAAYIALFFGQWPIHSTNITTEQAALVITELGLYASLAIIGSSIYLASWGTLMAVASATARNWLGRFRWLAGLAVLLIATWGMGWLHNSWLFTKATQWGRFNLMPLSLRSIIPANQGLEGIEIYAGEIAAVFLATLAVFAVAAWLIDNKVEV